MVSPITCGWLDNARIKLTRRWQSLPHGILLTGPEMIGKSLLAFDLARIMLCETGQNKSGCGICSSCQLVEQSVHPDLHVVTSEASGNLLSAHFVRHAERYWLEKKSTSTRKPSEQISVDSIRALNQNLAATASLGARKVVIFPIADQLNHNAANALLKLLEEPTGETFIILVTSVAHRLPATIRSRCVHFSVKGPSSSVVATWLQDEKGVAPETAAQFAGAGLGPFIIADLIERGVDGTLLEFLESIQGGNSVFGEFETLKRFFEALGDEFVLEMLQRQFLKQVRKNAGAGVLSVSDKAAMDRFVEIGEVRESLRTTIDSQLALEGMMIRIQS